MTNHLGPIAAASNDKSVKAVHGYASSELACSADGDAAPAYER